MSLVACGESDSSPADSADQSSETGTEQTVTSEDVDRTVTMEPQGNRMKYKQTEFTVAPGETVQLVFDNTATSPSMQHNVVILTSNNEDVFQRVGEGGMEAGSSNDYVPDDDAIIAYTPMSSPGETVEVTFTVPEEPGEYGYVCTFPGHWATMQGTMIVSEDATA